jgi:hypothetical protein
MTDQTTIAEMARLLAIIEGYWTTLFSVGDEIDAFTVQQVRGVPCRARQKLLTVGHASTMRILNTAPRWQRYLTFAPLDRLFLSLFSRARTA